MIRLALALGLLAATAQAQDKGVEAVEAKVRAATVPAPTAKKAAPGDIGRASFLNLFRSANPMLWPLGLCSVVTLGFTLERLVALRRRRIIPKDFTERFLDRLAAGKLDRERAAELCRANDSAMSRVFGHVVRRWGQPSASIRQGLTYEAAGEVAELRRNVRVLNGTATLAPLLGLLGTVFGMIESFDALGGRAAAGSSKSEALAHGISLALMSTAVGLAIAVVSVTAYYYLLNRVDVLIRDLDEHAGRAIDLVAAESPRPMAERRSAPGDRDRRVLSGD